MNAFWKRVSARDVATGLHSLQPWLQPYAVRLVNIAAAAGLTPKVSSARRSHAQQALLYRRFLAGQSRFPAAPPGHSTHELGLAFDLWINDESQLPDLGTVWEQMGGTWGGHFRDPIHFEAGGASEYSRAVGDSNPTDPIETIKSVGNFVAGLAAPTKLSLAQLGLQALPEPENPTLRRAVRIVTDPIGTVAEPWEAIAHWISSRFF